MNNYNHLALTLLFLHKCFSCHFSLPNGLMPLRGRHTPNVRTATKGVLSRSRTKGKRTRAPDCGVLFAEDVKCSLGRLAQGYSFAEG